jgi:hypothetical protein
LEYDYGRTGGVTEKTVNSGISPSYRLKNKLALMGQASGLPVAAFSEGRQFWINAV